MKAEVMNTATQTTEALVNREYKYGFVTEIENDAVPRGLSEATVRLISAKKNEPNFMLDWRLKAYRHWVKLAKSEAEPKWANVRYAPIDYQNLIYYSAPKANAGLKSIRAASCRATTRSESFILSRSPTITSRRIPAPR
jgi:Fe-S cluster assembly protein SufB